MTDLAKDIFKLILKCEDETDEGWVNLGGDSIEFYEKFDSKLFIEWIKKHKPNTFEMVSNQYKAMGFKDIEKDLLKKSSTAIGSFFMGLEVDLTNSKVLSEFSEIEEFSKEYEFEDFDEDCFKEGYIGTMLQAEFAAECEPLKDLFYEFFNEYIL